MLQIGDSRGNQWFISVDIEGVNMSLGIRIKDG